jgi:hypothetical protein
VEVAAGVQFVESRLRRANQLEKVPMHEATPLVLREDFAKRSRPFSCHSMTGFMASTTSIERTLGFCKAVAAV